jgi:alpha/beta hydrolase fold
MPVAEAISSVAKTQRAEILVELTIATDALFVSLTFGEEVTMNRDTSVSGVVLWNMKEAARSIVDSICRLLLCAALALGVALPVAAEELRRPEAFTHHYAQLRDIRLHYVREGSGPPLILLHGWPGFWWEWHLNIGPLAKDFDVIVPDMRGYGDSEKPPLDQPKLFSPDYVVEDVDALMEHLNIKQAYLVGHDWAAVIVHKFVRKYPNRVIKAMVIDPFVPGAEVGYFSPEQASESCHTGHTTRSFGATKNLRSIPIIIGNPGTFKAALTPIGAPQVSPTLTRLSPTSA